METISAAGVAGRVDDLDHLRWTTHAVEVREVGGVDAPVGQPSIPQPIQEAVPLALADEYQRKVPNVARVIDEFVW